MEIDWTTVAETVVLIIAGILTGAIFVTKLLDALKPVLPEFDGAIGVANQIASFVIALAAFVLKYFGQGFKADSAEALGLDLAATLISTYLISFMAWFIHTQVVKRINGEKEDEDKAAKVAPKVPAAAPQAS